MSEHISWETKQGSGDSEEAIDILEDGHLVASIGGSTFALRLARARRIVACVNACVGVPTPLLEEGKSIINVARLLGRRNAALLEALEAAYPILCGLVNEQRLDPEDARYVSDGWRVKELVRDAIKEAKPNDPV